MTIFRSILFFLWFAAISVVAHIAALPTLMLPRRVIVWTARKWSAANLWGLRVFAGLEYEVRGTIPTQGVLIASKHMSMWDTLALYALLDDAAVVIKRELLNVPFYGWFANKAGMIAIDRNAHASALRKMAEQARGVAADGRSIVIFPEGTRKNPGAAPDYKPGVAGLYTQLGLPCVPVALNSGLFWTGPGGFVKKSGAIVIEFLPPIPAGLKRAEFMRTLEQRTEEATAKLVTEGRKLLEKRDRT